jgi:hypothetical protein
MAISSFDAAKVLFAEGHALVRSWQKQSLLRAKMRARGRTTSAAKDAVPRPQELK